MGSTSTIPAVLDRLVAVLDAATTGTTQVFEGRPAPKEMGRELIFLGDVDSEDSVPTSRGSARAARDERYSIDVVICISLARGQARAARHRAYALRALLEEILASDKTCAAVPEVVHWTAGSHRLTSGLSNEGPWCVLTQTVSVYARLEGNAP